MKILFMATEIYPFVKTGGLGDVAGALPQALAKEGADIRLFLPGYPEILQNISKPKIIRKLSPFFGRDDAVLLKAKLPDGMTTYVLDCPGFYDRKSPYCTNDGKDWKDNHLRFAAFCRAAADLYLYDSEWQPDVIHGNDWQCGLMPVYLNLRGHDRPASVMTIHNIAYQGLFPASVLSDLNLPDTVFTHEGVEFYGKIGFLKAGLAYADAITTVSPTYAIEIQGNELGCGLDGLLRKRSQQLTGILNGIDEEVWNPYTDENIVANYDSNALKSKAKNKKALLKELNLTENKKQPVFGVISRLVQQKGLDLLVQAMPELLKIGASFVILGSGDKILENQFLKLATDWPSQVSVTIGYDEKLAHRIMAGVDAVIIPSRFEPCGLVQMYGLAYGTLPVVRRTGGLADTVIDEPEAGTGFVFDEPTAAALETALLRTCSLFQSAPLWKVRQENAMAKNFNWSSSAQKYLNLYNSLK